MGSGVPRVVGVMQLRCPFFWEDLLSYLIMEQPMRDQLTLCLLSTLYTLLPTLFLNEIGSASVSLPLETNFCGYVCCLRQLSLV